MHGAQDPENMHMAARIGRNVVFVDDNAPPRRVRIVSTFPQDHNSKPIYSISGTLMFSHNSQNMTYFVTKFGMRKFCVVP